MSYYDDLETRSQDEREADIARRLPQQIAHAKAKASAYAALLSEVDAASIQGREALAELPLTRKSDLVKAQGEHPPFGGYATEDTENIYIFQSPGPIYEPGSLKRDWWRLGRFLAAAGVGEKDIVQNCFAYHLTPAGHMFENAARAVGARILPAGTGQTDLQARAMADAQVTAYAGTPDYLKIILESAHKQGLDVSRLKKAVVGGGALFPSLRQSYADQGISCLQCYATADLGNIAYESEAMDGMIIDEGVLVEIVTPGTGTPVEFGEVGEVVVTSFNPDYPLIRFATGDLSAMMAGHSPCGRTNMRIKGWMGRADQTTKIKGMFVRPEQVAQLVASHEALHKARVIATREGEQDVMTVRLEAENGFNAETALPLVREALKLGGKIEIVSAGTLPKDGIVIEDQRVYD